MPIKDPVARKKMRAMVRAKKRAQQTRRQDWQLGHAYPLDPQHVLSMDLTVDAPDGFERLKTREQLALVHAYARDRARPWRAMALEAGINEQNAVRARRQPAVAQYIQAIAEYAAPWDEDPVALRAETMSALARVVREGDDREVVMAAKVLEGYLPALPKQSRTALDQLNEDELKERLADLLDMAGLSGGTPVPSIGSGVVIEAEVVPVARGEGGVSK